MLLFDYEKLDFSQLMILIFLFTSQKVSMIMARGYNI